MRNHLGLLLALCVLILAFCGTREHFAPGGWTWNSSMGTWAPVGAAGAAVFNKTPYFFGGEELENFSVYPAPGFGAPPSRKAQPQGWSWNQQMSNWGPVGAAGAVAQSRDAVFFGPEELEN